MNLKPIIILYFISLLNFNSLYSNEIDDFVNEVLNNPDSLFIFISDTNCVKPGIYRYVPSNYISIKQKLCYIKNSNLELIEKKYYEIDGDPCYSFDYSNPLYNSTLRIGFIFEKDRKSQKMKLYDFNIVNRMDCKLVDRIIGDPDNLVNSLNDTNIVNQKVFGPFSEKDINKFKVCLSYIKNNKLKQLDMDKFNNNCSKGKYLFIEYEDPIKKSIIKISLYFLIEEKSGKWKLYDFEIVNFDG